MEALNIQVLMNVGSGVALAVGGWFCRQMWSAVQELRTDMSKLREELPKTYITKNDFKDAVHELKALLITINAKLDHKVDKH